jgi:5-methylcytosine-specific restriction endonuclease McrA
MDKVDARARLKSLLICPETPQKPPPQRKAPRKTGKVSSRSPKALKQSLQRLWSEAVRRSWGGFCGCCGKSGTQAHHFFHRSGYPSVKYDVDNGMWLCFACHILKVHRNGQGEMARDALINHIGIRRFEELKARAREVRRFRTPDLLALEEQLKVLHE